MQQPLLVVDDASFAYGQRHVLNAVSLNIDVGEIFVLLGPNGSGKSTLVKAITGQLRLDGGDVRVSGASPARTARARRDIGVVPQNIALYEKLNAGENLNVIGRLMGVAANGLDLRIRQMLDRIKLGDRAKDRAEVLSGGMRRRLNIAAGLMHGPRLLILDEPTAGVDQAGKQAIRELLISLRDSGLAVLLTTHEMDEAQALADRVGILVGGHLKATGRPDELVREHFGDTVEVIVLIEGAEHVEGEEDGLSLARLGLTYDASTGQWRGLVAEHETSIEILIRSVGQTGLNIKDVRVRRPGLDTLLSELTVRERPR